MRDIDALKELTARTGIQLNQVDTIFDANGQYLYGKAYTLEQDRVTGLALINKNLETIPREIFSLTGLRILVVIGNQFSHVPDTLDRLPDLQILDLSHNQVTHLPDSVGKLVQLKKLFLKKNHLRTLPDSLRSLVCLEKLNLSTNEFQSLPDFIGELACLQNLNVKSNELEYLPASLGKLLQLQKLNAGYNRLSTVPDCIGNLVSLENLNVSYNLLDRIPIDCRRLKNLKRLDVSYNRLKKLPCELTHSRSLQQLVAEGNRIEILEDSIAELPSLQKLFLNFNLISEIPDSIGQMTSLRALFVQSNRLENLPESLGRLTGLQTLMAGSNCIRNLPGTLCGMTGLQNLDLSSNLLHGLPEGMAQLRNLQTLDLNDNRINCLPEEILALDIPLVYDDFLSDRGINLYKNPLLSPPVEVVKQGNDAVRNYYAQIKSQGRDTIYEAKIMIVGEPGAGKTSLLNKLFDRNFKVPDMQQKSTIGIDVRRNWEFKINESLSFTASVWDFGGQQIQYTLHHFFLTTDCLYILMAEKRKELLHLDYWLHTINVLGKNCPVIIVFNEINIDSIPSFLFDEKKYKELFPGLDLIRLDINLADTEDGRFDLLVKKIQEKLKGLELINRSVPANWITVRQELESRKEKRTIGINEYFEICRQFQIIGEQDQLLLLRYFHLLGIILHFEQDMNLRDTLFLDPDWTMNAVYTLLSDKEMVMQNGIIRKDFIDNLWIKRGFRFGERTKLLQLMLKNNFELCYNLPGTNDHYIVPLLLSNQKPEYSWDNNGNMLFRLQYPFMPRGIISRLIVRLHEYVEDRLVWSQGMVLCRKGVKAQILERYTIQEALKIIEIRLAGIPLLCKEFLTVIREELNRIQKSSFPDLPYEELVPCRCPKCRISAEPNFFYYKVLEDFLINGDMEIQCMMSRKMIQIPDLIQTVFTDREMMRINTSYGSSLNDKTRQGMPLPIDMFLYEHDFNEDQKRIILDIVNTNLIHKQIAEKFHIDENALAQRLKKIYRKCGVQSKTELLRKIMGG